MEISRASRRAAEPPLAFTQIIAVVTQGGEPVLYALDKTGKVWRGNDRGEWHRVPMERKS